MTNVWVECVVGVKETGRASQKKGISKGEVGGRVAEGEFSRGRRQKSEGRERLRGIQAVKDGVLLEVR